MEYSRDEDGSLRARPLKEDGWYIPVTREEFEELKERVDSVNRTLDGLQVLLGKASEYKARSRGRKRLP